HGLRTAVAEALAHGSGLRTLQRKRLRRGAQGLFAGVFGIAHSSSRFDLSLSWPGTPLSPAALPLRQRLSLRLRSRKPPLAGLASRAACTTFGRPRAKSNWLPVNRVKEGVFPPPSASIRRKSPSSLRTPSRDPSLP